MFLFLFMEYFFYDMIIIGEDQMKRKKGFTLIELLAVIALLGILGTLAVTSAINISADLKTDMYCEKLTFIESQAKLYGNDHFTSDMDVELSLLELMQLGYLKADQEVEGSYFLDPRDNSSMDQTTVRIYANNKRSYAHVNVDDSMCDE